MRSPSATTYGDPLHEEAVRLSRSMFHEAAAELAALTVKLVELHEQELAQGCASPSAGCVRQSQLGLCSCVAREGSACEAVGSPLSQPEPLAQVFASPVFAVKEDVESPDKGQRVTRRSKGSKNPDAQYEEFESEARRPSRRNRSKESWGRMASDLEGSTELNKSSVREELDVRPDWNIPVEIENKLPSLQQPTSGMPQRLVATIHNKLQHGTFETPMRIHGSHRMLHPQSTTCFVWDLLNLCFIVYELVVTPIQVFIVDQGTLFEPLDWVAATFWTLDIFCTFCRATYINSEIVWDWKRVAQRYFQTWFLIDFLTVAPDWVVIISGAAFLKALPFLRSMKLLKLMRLLRLVKMDKVVRGVQARINSSYAVHCIDISKLAACIVIFNHLLACVWYRIGAEEDGWARDFRENPVLGYWTALHWAISQFHGSMEVAPANLKERIVAVAVVLLALIGFSQFLSSLTDMMIQLQRLRHDTTRRQDLLRSYLTEYKISTQVSVSAKKYIEHEVDMLQKTTQEAEVLQMLPRNLQMDLHNEARSPLLGNHTLFMRLKYQFPRAVRMLSHEAIVQLPVHSGESVFTLGDACSRMLFIHQGCAVYTYSKQDRTDTPGSPGPGQQQWKLGRGEWICELALWTVWVNVGDFKAYRNSLILEIETTKLHHVLRQFHHAFLHVSLYAQGFIDDLRSCKTITDLDMRSMTAVEAVEGFQSEEGSESSSQRDDAHGEDTAGVNEALDQPQSGTDQGQSPAQVRWASM